MVPLRKVSGFHWIESVRSKVPGQKWPIKSGRWTNCVVKMKPNLKSSAVGKFKEALEVFPDTLSVPLCLPRKELHGLPKVLYFSDP